MRNADATMARMAFAAPSGFRSGMATLAAFMLLYPWASACAQAFKPLFDGQTLKGWHAQGEGTWRVKDGVIIGTHSATGKEYGHLVSDSAHGDFVLRYQWKLVKGNSGLYYHSQEGGDAGMIGPQVEMDGAYPGGIYTTNTDPWGWIAQPSAAAVKTWYKPGDWNLVTVSSRGAQVAVTYNGIQTALTSDARLPASGRFGFQVHRGLECEIWLKDIELALPATAVSASGSASAGRVRKPVGNATAPFRGWRDRHFPRRDLRGSAVPL